MVVRRAESGPPSPAGLGDAAVARQSAPSPVLRSVPPPGASGWFDRVVRFLRGLMVALAIVVFWSGALGLAWIVVPAVYLSTRDLLVRRRRMQRTVAACWRGFLGTLGVLRLYRCAYRGDSVLAEPAVLVANHPSLLDVTAIIGRMPHVCCVVKSSLIHSPLVGRLLRACGHVAAGDGTLMGGKGVLDAVGERLAEGFPVLVFPEGTRSPFGGMHRLRRGAFEAAKRAGVPVVPLFLRCDPPALGKGTPVWQYPRRCPTLTVDIGPPLDTNGRDPTNLCKNVEADFRARLGLTAVTGEQSK